MYAWSVKMNNSVDALHDNGCSMRRPQLDTMVLGVGELCGVGREDYNAESSFSGCCSEISYCKLPPESNLNHISPDVASQPYSSHVLDRYAEQLAREL